MGFRVAVAGASGYAGGEVLRLLAAHPELDVVTVTGHSSVGRTVGEVQPHLASSADLVFQDTTTEVLAGHDVVFLALPHGQSGAIAAQLPDDVLVIDAGADHRLTSEADWHAFYPGEWHGAWTYGVPELPTADGRLRTALAATKRIAAPGCNASAVSLALAPAVAAGLVEQDDLVAVLAVGPSGAGRSSSPALSASELLGSANAYQIGGVHRHVPEILQNLALVTGVRGTVSFTPVLVPMARGILATCTARLAPDADERRIRAVYEEAYGDERFVRLLPAGRFPAVEHTIGANTLLLGLAVDAAANRLVVVAALDNLVKGTAGAAIQSANLALGLPEAAGLPLDGTAP
ncbi:N-acetyl-gamma-glutamyl-phosphate reductase [Amnibacterium kyonggiense]|uniref:N-acetyl-gamma-glutamyl-phosphate reductase n=1 Tax=Amnibacterium kyonggiense TaxID=595671 RepID=A0A4R7FI54_9MICO|nr:N-acetyl-gamma-glutamyl-phosphate reductase [Amnibacterium kyonggiense]TDS75571.1 N-acetyl-gamma-glutamyl-phosphate reductase [Amnibacterium kyonggiense]